MKYIINHVARLYCSKLLGYLLVSYRNSTEITVQKLLTYPRFGYLTGGSMKNGALTVVWKHVMITLFIKACLLEFLLFWYYTKIIINEVIYNTLQLIPKIVVKVLSTKKKNVANWYYEHRESPSYSEEEYNDHSSVYINPRTRVDWIERINEIRKLITLYKIRGNNVRKIIKIVEKYDVKDGKIRWHIPITWHEQSGKVLSMKVKELVRSFIFKNFSYILPEEFEMIESKFVKTKGGFMKGIIKKVNDDYIVSIQDVHKIRYSKVVFDGHIPHEEIKLFPSAMYVKYVFKGRNIIITMCERAKELYQRYVFHLDDVKKMNDAINRPVYLSEPYVPDLHKFCDLFIKVFEKLGINIPYVKDFSNLENYFRYPYISRNVYDAFKSYTEREIDLDKVDAFNPSVMKLVWNKLNIPKSLRTMEAKALLMYKSFSKIDEANKVKYAKYLSPTMVEIAEDPVYFLRNRIPNVNEMVTLIEILYKYKKSLLNDLNDIVNMVKNDNHIVDTIWMLKRCDSDYPEELTGFLNRFKLEELHDNLSIEISKLRDKEATIPYAYHNIFKDKKVFDLGDNYELRIPENKLDLITLGNRLSICVGSSPVYHNMIKNSKGFIFMMYYKGKEYGCIEYRDYGIEHRRCGIVQAMLEYNIPIKQKDTICYSKLEKFVKEHEQDLQINTEQKQIITQEVEDDPVEDDPMVVVDEEEELPW